MAKLNVKRESIKTHEGATAKHINAELQLRRSVMACLLWEGQFYEDGQEIAGRIASLIKEVDPLKVSLIATEARQKMKLRHVPLLITREMARLPSHRHLVATTLFNVIQRADELTEFLAIYWKDGRCPLSAQVKKGLATAFRKFSAYDLAKYNRDGTVKLRDVLFLCHANPMTTEDAETWKKLIAGKLEPPDTWEVALSASKGADKKAVWERLIGEQKLGALAYIRNLRNMREAGIDHKMISKGLLRVNTARVLPFRFIAAAVYNPTLEPELEKLMFSSLQEVESLPGETAIVVDCSGSMTSKLSEKSQMTRNDAGCALAMLLREMCVDGCDIYAFGSHTKQLPPRRGFALRDVIRNSDVGYSTVLGDCIRTVSRTEYDRIIVVTDEQSHDTVPNPRGTGYVINVASCQNGIGYGPWIHIDGWSEAIVSYIKTLESES